MKGIAENFWCGGGSYKRRDGSEGLCEEQRFREGKGEQMENEGSHCVKKIHGHTDSLMNKKGDPTFDWVGREHICTNLTPNQGVTRLEPLGTGGQAGPAAAGCGSSTQPAQRLWPVPTAILWLFSQNSTKHITCGVLPSLIQLYSNKVEWC